MSIGPHSIGEVYAASMFYHWTDPDALTKMLFGDVHENYQQVWRDRYRAGFHYYFFALDYDHQIAFMMLAMGEYGDSAIKHVAANTPKVAK